MVAPARGSRRVAPAVALAVAALALVFLALELGLRATFVGEVTGPCETASAEMIWAKRPGCGEINAHGFRDRDYGFAKPADVYRLVLIGDSVVEGAGVALGQTFGKRLEADLNALGSRRFQVIQLAVRGYTLSQELELLRGRAAAYDPDVILWSYVFNDPIHPRHHSIHFDAARLGERRAWSAPTMHAAAFLAERWFLLRERWRGRGCPAEYHRFYHCAYQRQVTEGIAEIARLADAHGVPLVFLIQPLYHPGAFERYGYTDLHQLLRALAEANDLPVVDLLDAYRGRDVREVGVVDGKGRVDVWHPGPAGHHAIADHLRRSLQRDGFVP